MKLIEVDWNSWWQSNDGLEQPWGRSLKAKQKQMKTKKRIHLKNNDSLADHIKLMVALDIAIFSRKNVLWEEVVETLKSFAFILTSVYGFNGNDSDDKPHSCIVKISWEPFSGLAWWRLSYGFIRFQVWQNRLSARLHTERRAKTATSTSSASHHRSFPHIPFKCKACGNGLMLNLRREFWAHRASVYPTNNRRLSWNLGWVIMKGNTMTIEIVIQKI
jgi:hypothetical protein